MKTIKFILWPILVFCCLWMSAIFFGPSLISKATSYFSDGRVKLTRVTVTPKLTVSIAVVDFVLPRMFGRKDLRASSRAVSLDWKIVDGFELIGSSGPSSSKEYGTLGSANFSLKPNSLVDWSDVGLNLEFKQFVGANSGALEGSLSGKITKHFKILSDFTFASSMAFGEIANNPFRVDELIASTDHYKIGQPLTLQNTGTNFSAKRLLLSKEGIKASSVNGEIKLSKGTAILKASISDPQIDKYDLKADKLAITSSYSILDAAFEGAGEFSISDIVSKSPTLNIKDYRGSYKISSSGTSLKGKVFISDFILKTDQYFIGQIKNAILDFSLESRPSPSGADLRGVATLALKDEKDFMVNVSIDSLLTEVSILNCFQRRCDLDALGVKYAIFASEFALTGDLKCGKLDCLSRPLRHVIRTDHTNNFFQALSDTGILSPLALPVAYLAVSGGEPSGDGHVVNF